MEYLGNQILSLAKKNKWIIIGISGGTNTGKTTLSTKLAKNFPANVIHQDHYFRNENDPNHIWESLGENQKHQNWESLECIDWNLMFQKILEIVSRPYEQSSSKTSLLIIDGHIIFNHSVLKNLFSLKFFIELDDKIKVYKRRLKRDYLPPDPAGYFDKIVWPMYLKNKSELMEQNIVYIDGKNGQDEIFNFVCNELKKVNKK